MLLNFRTTGLDSEAGVARSAPPHRSGHPHVKRRASGKDIDATEGDAAITGRTGQIVALRLA